MKDSFVFLPSYLEAAAMLNDEQRLQFFDALCEYGVNQEIKDDIDPTIKAMVIVCAGNIDASKKRRENGKKGGAPKGNQNAKTTKSNQIQPMVESEQPMVESETTKHIKDVDVDVDVDVEKEESKPEKKSRFTPPSIQDISAYCQEKGYSFDINRFFDYYQSNGWMVGKNKMRDWRAAVRSWAAREHPPDKQGPRYMQREGTVNASFGTEYITAELS